MLRSFIWRTLGLAGAVLAAGTLAGLLSGRVGRVLRGTAGHGPSASLRGVRVPNPAHGSTVSALELVVALVSVCIALILIVLVIVRGCARSRRRYVRLAVVPYRGDVAEPASLEHAYAALHAALLRRWWTRAFTGQPSIALELHHFKGEGARGCAGEAALALCCPAGFEAVAESALRVAYPNVRLQASVRAGARATSMVRLRKRAEFIRRTSSVDPRQRGLSGAPPPVDALLARMGGCGDCSVQIALTPVPAAFERVARHSFRSHEARISRRRHEHPFARDRSLIDETELRGGLQVQHAPLFFADMRVLAGSVEDCERIAAVLRSRRGENRLAERRVAVRGRIPRYMRRRVERGEGNPIPSLAREVLATAEACDLWQLPSVDFSTIPFARGTLPVAPAPPGVFRPGTRRGLMRDALGPVSIHPELRRQNVAVPGAVEQGKSSFLAASVAEDLRRERCAVIVLDPKGDAAEAALSAVPAGRTCTLLDFAEPSCGFNPLEARAPADVIADYVVGALKNLFDAGDIRASSDRYLRNAIVAVLATDPKATLWDAARLLSVGEEGYAYRRAIAARVRTLPELKEISSFFTAELTAQLADARSATTSKLDAPVNKLARLLNSPSIKRVLLNDSLRIDFEGVIERCEVLVVKGALGAMGSGNTSVLMQLLVGMLDAALARRQDRVEPERRTAVALKIDEAPLVVNRGFAETMALKRSAGLETVACWQTDSQWVEREVRDQLDALFAHRVYFATASVSDARASAAVTMAEFSDSVRPGVGRNSVLGSPDVRLRLPRHHAIASFTTPEGRQAAFVAETIPMHVDRARLAMHAAAQAARGARPMTDLSQPHWQTTAEPAPAAAGPAFADDVGRRGAAAEKLQAPTLQKPRERAEPNPGSVTDTEVRARRASPGHRTHEVRPGPPSVAASDSPRQARGSAATTGHPHAEPEPKLPSVAADSYRELLDLDRAGSARRVPPPRGGSRAPARLEAADRAVLELVGDIGYILSSQIHRHLNPGRDATGTQRRLRRLAEAGLLARHQLHRSDGGGVPMVYSLTPVAQEILERELDRPLPAPAERPEQDSDALRRALHTAGWGLALARLGYEGSIHGAHASVLAPPRGSSPDTLTLPGGRTAHDFLRTDRSGERSHARRFETIRPDATIALRHPAPERPRTTTSAGHASRESPVVQPPRPVVDLLLDFDDRCSAPGWPNRVERYEHFLAGWSELMARYRDGGPAEPVLVFVCRNRARARLCARRADHLLSACRAYPGEHPRHWHRLGRERMLWVGERDVHEGSTLAWRVPALPTELRTDPTAGGSGATELGTAVAGRLPVLS